MTSRKIARDYLTKVETRLEALRLFLDRGRNDDVVREAHEAIELLLKGALRFIGIDPPKLHKAKLSIGDEVRVGAYTLRLEGDADQLPATDSSSLDSYSA